MLHGMWISESGAALPQAAPMPPRQQALEWMVRSVLAFAASAFCVLGLLAFSGAILPLLGSGGAVGELVGGEVVTESAFTQPAFRIIYLITALSILTRPLDFWRAAARHRWCWALIGLSVLSAAWSVTPRETAQLAFRLTATSLFALVLVLDRDLRGLLRLCAWALGLIAVLSVVFAVAIPAYGISAAPHEGAWRGVFAHKNTLGSVMSLGAVLFILLARSGARHRWALWLGAALSLALVVLSRSTTALVVLAAVLALLPLFHILRWSHRLTIPLLIFAVLLASGLGVGLVANAESVLAALGKDVTLTGRTDLWAAVLRSIGERPLLGYGYKGFWAEGNRAVDSVQDVLGWSNIDSHNGFLDVTLDLGLIGLFLLLAGLVVAARRGVALIRSTPSPLAVWPLVILSFLLLQNLAETSFLYPRSLLWVLFVATVCVVEMQVTGAGGAAARGPRFRGRPLDDAPAPRLENPPARGRLLRPVPAPDDRSDDEGGAQ